MNALATRLLEREGGDDKSTLEVKISGPSRNVAKMGEMLRWIDHCSSIGHSAEFSVFVDGDGAAQINVDGLDESIGSEMLAAYADSNKEPESFGLD
jgi:hypothetical protein